MQRRRFNCIQKIHSSWRLLVYCEKALKKQQLTKPQRVTNGVQQQAAQQKQIKSRVRVSYCERYAGYAVLQQVECCAKENTKTQNEKFKKQCRSAQLAKVGWVSTPVRSVSCVQWFVGWRLKNYCLLPLELSWIALQVQRLCVTQKIEQKIQQKKSKKKKYKKLINY